jgi:hypothetical protein
MGRTIEDIEREAAEIERAERDAFATLARCLRELAVALPAGSTVPRSFARLAKDIDLFNTGPGTDDAVFLSALLVVREYAARRRQAEETS